MKQTGSVIKSPVLRVLCGLLCLFAVLALLPACQPKEQTLPDAGTESGTQSPATVSAYRLEEFTVVRSDNASDEVTKAVMRLKSTLKEYENASLSITTDLLEQDETACEILIGTDRRAVYNSETAALSGDRYVIRTVLTDAGCKIILGGATDAALLGAIEAFELLAKNGELLGDSGTVSTLNITGMGSAVLEAEKLTQLTFIYDKNLNDTTKKGMRLMAKELGLLFGQALTTVEATEATDLSAYPYAIVLGKAGKTATEMTAKLSSETTYRAVIESTSDSWRAYCVGGNDIAVLRALQHIYRHGVKERTAAFPLTLDVTVTPHRVRDPFILSYGGIYYLYENASNTGYRVRTSTDLYNWSEAKQVFTFPQACDTWAPECHYYNGNFYIIGSYSSQSTGWRGVGIFRSSCPDGQFTLISKSSASANTLGHITTGNRNIIDGTLYVDKAGKPWLVYSNEWDKAKWQAGDRAWIGSLAYAPLSDDLTHLTAAPTVMFEADAAPWSNYGICEAPWFYRCEDGTLLLLWSNNTDAGAYSVGIAVSSNGEIDGEWTHVATPLFTSDASNLYCTLPGGHGMVFQDMEGRMYLAVHTPNNDKTNVALTLVPIVESDGMLRVDTIKKS